MNQTESEALILRAANYFRQQGAEFVPETGRVAKRTPEGHVVKFLVPEALDPNCVVDPPDIWALVTWKGDVEFLRQY